MRVAIVTPYHDESDDILTRCHLSVQNQTYTDIFHLFVSDGNPSSYVKNLAGIGNIDLYTSHGDAGATPRCIGAVSAFSTGFDAVAFLDADNTYVNTHVEKMVSTMRCGRYDVVAATRNICDVDGNILYVDRIESDGDNFCDTNCLFIGKSTLHLLTYWVTDPAYQLWSDRAFWAAIKQTNLSVGFCLVPTVNYNSRWAWHYQQAGKIPPPDSVWMSIDPTGKLIHSHHCNTHEE